MLSFKEFLIESAPIKNLHLEHIEDEIFNLGVRGARESINFLRSLRDMLSGDSQSSVKVTVKFDGAPAVFVGIDPSDGKFFVGTKGVFNKDPKIVKKESDIENLGYKGGLAEKLKVAFKELKSLGITGVLQGDIMFTKGDFEEKEIPTAELEIDDSSKSALRQLVKLLEENVEIEDLQNSIYSIAKENQVQPKDFFKILYQIILSTNRGPKIGPFIEDIGKKKVADIISKYI